MMARKEVRNCGVVFWWWWCKKTPKGPAFCFLTTTRVGSLNQKRALRVCCEAEKAQGGDSGVCALA